jgi:hypothetical protein
MALIEVNFGKPDIQEGRAIAGGLAKRDWRQACP